MTKCYDVDRSSHATLAAEIVRLREDKAELLELAWRVMLEAEDHPDRIPADIVEGARAAIAKAEKGG